MDYWGARVVRASGGPNGEGTFYTLPGGDSSITFTQKPSSDGATGPTIEQIYMQISNAKPAHLAALADQWQNMYNLLQEVWLQVYEESNALYEEHWKSPQARDTFMKWGPGKVLAYLDDWQDAALANQSGLRTAVNIVLDFQGQMDDLWHEYQGAIEDAKNDTSFGSWLSSEFTSWTESGAEDKRLQDRMDHVRDKEHEYNKKAQQKAWDMAQQLFDTLSTLSGGHGTPFMPPDAVLNSPGRPPISLNAGGTPPGAPPGGGVPPSLGPLGTPPSAPKPDGPSRGFTTDRPPGPPRTFFEAGQFIRPASDSLTGPPPPLPTDLPDPNPAGLPPAAVPPAVVPPALPEEALPPAPGTNGLTRPGANGLARPGDAGNPFRVNNLPRNNGVLQGRQGLSAPDGPARSGMRSPAPPASRPPAIRRPARSGGRSEQEGVLGRGRTGRGGDAPGRPSLDEPFTRSGPRPAPPVLNRGRPDRTRPGIQEKTTPGTPAGGSILGQPTAPPVLGRPPAAPPEPETRRGTTRRSTPAPGTEWVGTEAARLETATPILDAPAPAPTGASVSRLEEVPAALRGSGSPAVPGLERRSTVPGELSRRTRHNPVSAPRPTDAPTQADEPTIVTDEDAFQVETPGGGVLGGRQEDHGYRAEPRTVLGGQ